MRGGVELPPPRRGTSLCPWLLFWGSIQFEFTYGARTLWGAIIQINLKNRKFAYLCGLLLHYCNNNKMGPRVTFSGIKETFFDSSTLIYICLHSSKFVKWLVYSRLVTRLHPSTFIYDSSTFVYTCLLHSSSDLSVFLEQI